MCPRHSVGLDAQHLGLRHKHVFFFLLGLGTQMFWKQWDSCYWKIMQSFITMATLGIIFVVKDHVTSQASSSLKRYLNYSEMKFGTK